jgi:hypothetical protein
MWARVAEANIRSLETSPDESATGSTRENLAAFGHCFEAISKPILPPPAWLIALLGARFSGRVGKRVQRRIGSLDNLRSSV